MANSAAGFKFYAGVKGSNILTVGQEGSVFNYTDISEAVAAAKPKDTIKVYPGTYTVTAPLTIIKDLTIIGIGGPYDCVITSALATQTCKVDLPVSHTADVHVKFQNIKFLNTSTGSALYIDNVNAATAAYDLYLDCEDCIILNTSTGFAFQSVHTTAAKDIYINIAGSPVIHSISKSIFAAAKALSTTSIYGMICTGVFTLGNNAVATTFNMLHCVYASTAQTDTGNAARLNNYVGNFYGAAWLGGVLTKGAAGDFDAAGTEAAIIYS